MAVLKMQRISICALKKDRKAILEKLQSLGVVEINHVIEEDEDFKKMDTAGQKAGFEKASTLAEQAIDILDKYVPEKKSMFASLEGKALIEREEEERIRNERRDLLKTAKPILVIPACFLGGAVFCLFCDLIARTVFSPTELSISSVTAVFGAPVVLYVMINRKRG